MIPTLRQGALDDVAAQLGTILPTNGYRTTLITNERGWRAWDEVKPQEMPYLGFGPSDVEREEAAHEPGFQLRVVLPFMVVAHFAPTDQSQKTQMASDIIDDVLSALEKDTRRNGNATMTHLVSIQTDESFVEPARTLALGLTVVMYFAIVYERSTNPDPQS